MDMMKVVLCVWIEPYIENDLSFCVWPVHTPTTSKEVLTLSASTSPLPYTGNKSCIVNTILSVMPKHTVYIDPCMGSAEVFFRKPRAEKEILNDYNGDLVNLFRVIQNNEKLAYLLGRLYLSINGELAFKQNKDTCLASKLTNIELSDICPLAKAGQPFEVARENTCEECKYFCRIHYEVDPEYGDKQVHFWMNEEIVTFF